jgi:hypothetical protein
VGLRSYGPHEGNILNMTFVKEALSYYPILTIVSTVFIHRISSPFHFIFFSDLKDDSATWDCHIERLDAQSHAEWIEHIKRLFGHVGSHILSVFCPLTAAHNYATHTTHISQDCNTSMHNDLHLKKVTSTTAISSHIPTTSVMINRRLGNSGGYSKL